MFKVGDKVKIDVDKVSSLSEKEINKLKYKTFTISRIERANNFRHFLLEKDKCPLNWLYQWELILVPPEFSDNKICKKKVSNT